MPKPTHERSVAELTARIHELQGPFDAARARAASNGVPLPISWHSPLGNTIRPEAVSASHQRWIEALEAERAVTAASLDLAQLHLEAVADAPGATDAEIASLSAALDETKAAYHRARAAYFQATQGQREVEERRQRNLIRVRQLEAEIARIDRGLASHREYMDAAEQELQRREAQTVSQMEQEAA